MIFPDLPAYTFLLDTFRVTLFAAASTVCVTAGSAVTFEAVGIVPSVMVQARTTARFFSLFLFIFMISFPYV
ncbi:hypothetical protein DXA56_13080 [Blautia obeum]|nr:hypothetical protein DXA56_13080 [Blautia obeum]